ncbi:MAG: hypothetical protein DBY30_09465 [Verrucomicrobia bacterium]|nr:MAG: hypothetical protein DBY30_09465 [Verrucomicrobiota bacterium]
MKNSLLYVLTFFLSISVFADNENYDGQDVSGMDFGGKSLVNSSWSGSTAVGAYFTRANLSNANFTNANLTNASFLEAIIEGARFGSDNGTFTKYQLYTTASYKNKDLRNIQIINKALVEWDFTGQNLMNAVFDNIQTRKTNFTNADLRGAHFTYFGMGNTEIYKNTIGSQGTFGTFEMNDVSDSFSIRKYIPAEENGEMISAVLNKNAGFISGGAILTLENGAVFNIGGKLTVQKGSSIVINTDANSSTKLTINPEDSTISYDKYGLVVLQAGSLIFESGAILEVNIVDDISAQDILQVEIMEFAENANNIAGLDALVKGETILLNVNGSEWLGEWDYAIENNQMLITVAVPEPAVCAAAIGALSLLIAARRRMR